MTASFSMVAQAGWSSGAQFLMHSLAAGPNEKRTVFLESLHSQWFLAFSSFFFKLCTSKTGKWGRSHHPKWVRVDIKQSLFGGPRSIMTHLNSLRRTIVWEREIISPENKKKMETKIPRLRALQFILCGELFSPGTDPAGGNWAEPSSVPSPPSAGKHCPSWTHSSYKLLQNSLKYFKNSGEKLLHMFRLAMHAQLRNK